MAKQSGLAMARSNVAAMPSNSLMMTRSVLSCLTIRLPRSRWARISDTAPSNVLVLGGQRSPRADRLRFQGPQFLFPASVAAGSLLGRAYLRDQKALGHLC